MTTPGERDLIDVLRERANRAAALADNLGAPPSLVEALGGLDAELDDADPTSPAVVAAVRVILAAEHATSDVGGGEAS